MSYTHHLKTRMDDIDGVSGWMWVLEDDGAWDGPSVEWVRTHRDAYLRYARGRDVVVQAGGNCGLYPRLFANYFKTVYTFEPDALNFHCLVNNCQQDNIIKINACLGEETKLVSVPRANLTNVGCHRVAPDIQGGIIPQFKVDQLGLTACDFIQLDIEGYEIHALKGAEETIKRFQPGISCENGHPELTAYLEQFGYSIKEQVGADTVYSCFPPTTQG